MRGLTVAGLLVGMALCLPGAALAGEGCPNEQLRAENNSLGLPDCRAFEMVTPVEKDGVAVGVVPGTVAADGSSLAAGSNEGFGAIENDEANVNNGGSAFYRFTRTGSGWVTTPLNPRGTLESMGVGDSVWSPVEHRTVVRLWLRASDGSLSEIGPLWPPALGPDETHTASFRVLGVAAEAVKGVVFTVLEQGFLWPFDSPLDGRPLYEYKGSGNTMPSLVGVSGDAGSTALISQCGTELGAGDFDYRAPNAVSEDGGTVFFTAKGIDSDDCGGTQPPVDELFARIGGSQTVAISEPAEADCPLCDTSAPMDASFQGASADGSKVFFTTAQPLLGHDASDNLYEYDFAPPAGQPKVVRVSAGDGSVSEPAAEVQSVPYVSEDGSHVYFYAKGVLTTGTNSLGEHAQPGGENLYVYERDAEYPTGRTAFITGCGDTSNGQLTPNGRFLLFASGCHLTAGDTSTARQVFQYNAQTGSLVRVSVGLEGYNDNGNVGAGEAQIAGSRLEALVARGGGLTRSMSDDGSFVFFQSPVGLTPEAPNDEIVADNEGSPVYAQNVYEYHDGRVWLITSDSSLTELSGSESGAFHPVLAGVSASGGDVFIETGNQLVPRDTDTESDVYDARVAGGFRAPVAPLGCVGDTCQGSQSAPPAFAAPASAVFTGGGNLASPPPEPAVAPKGLTVAQKLSRALKACLREPRRKRASCEAKAQKRYGRSAKATKSDRRSK